LIPCTRTHTQTNTCTRALARSSLKIRARAMTIVIPRLVRALFFPQHHIRMAKASGPDNGQSGDAELSVRRSGDHNAPCVNRECMLSLVVVVVVVDGSDSGPRRAVVTVVVVVMAVATTAAAAVTKGGEGRVGDTGPTFVHLRDLSTGPRARARTHVRTPRTYVRAHARTHLCYAQGTRNPASPSSTPMRTR